MGWYFARINTLITTPIQQLISTSTFYSKLSRIYSTSTLSKIKSVQRSSSSSSWPFLNNIFYSNILERNVNKSKIPHMYSFSKHVYSPPIFSKPVFMKSVQQRNSNSPVLDVSRGAKRFYNVVTRNHFSQSSTGGSIRWIGWLLLFSYVSINAYPELVSPGEEFLETVPFTNRVHYVDYRSKSEIQRANNTTLSVGYMYRDKKLPYHHPETIRIRFLSRKITTALRKALRFYDEKNGTGQSKCLDGLRFNFLVVDDPIENALCYDGGNIVIFTGLIEKLSSDDELAFVIAHEVAHALARHEVERRTKFKWWESTSEFLNRFLTVDEIREIQTFIQFPLVVRFETEADRIALLLMAFAGYDPRVGPKFIKKFVDGFQRCFRLISVGRAKVMDEAMNLYKMRVGKSYIHPAAIIFESQAKSS